MNSLTPIRTTTRPMLAHRSVHDRKLTGLVASSRAGAPQIDRRSAMTGIAGLTLLLTSSAAAKNLQDAAKAKEERRAQLAKAAQEMKETGKTEAVFDDSSYAVSEDKSPNIHTRQEEGARTSR